MPDTSFTVTRKKAQARFRELRDTTERHAGLGEFFLLLEISAQEDVYIPLSIASGKKPTGFVYQIEGTAQGGISKTDISVSGEGVTQITLGTLVYVKIPAGKTATFRILIEIRGKTNEEYMVAINRINYKRSPSDAQYQKFQTEIRGKTLKSN